MLVLGVEMVVHTILTMQWTTNSEEAIDTGPLLLQVRSMPTKG